MIEPCGIAGAYLIERPTYADERGFFRECLRLDELQEAVGHPLQILQVNHSRTCLGALRGLHAEHWEKVVYVPHGRVFQVIADIRPDSPTFGKVETFELGEDNRLSLFLPNGVANGCAPLSPEADYVYLVTSYYDGNDTYAVRWDDPDLGVPWPVKNPLLSQRDQSNPSLRELFPEKFDR